MPFTPSHVAAVLPVLGRPWCGPWTAAGLVAGTMAPDLPYVADSLLHGVYRYGALTHRWWAVPTLDVLIAAAVAGTWRGLLGAPLTGLLPWRPVPAVPAVPAPVDRRPPGAVAGLAVAAAAGAATHVLWDSFTHPGRAGVRALPVLARPWVAGVPGCTVLQYATSLLGLAALGRHAAPARHAARADRTVHDRAVHDLPPSPRAAAAGLVLCAAAGAAHRLARREGGPSGAPGEDTAVARWPVLRERGPIDEAAFGAMAGQAVGAVAYAVYGAARRHLGTRP